MEGTGQQDVVNSGIDNNTNGNDDIVEDDIHRIRFQKWRAGFDASLGDVLRVSGTNEIIDQLREFQAKIEGILDSQVCCDLDQLEFYFKEGLTEASSDCANHTPEMDQKFRELKTLLRKKNSTRRENETKFARKAMQYATAKYCEIMEGKLNLKIPLKPEELKVCHERTVAKIMESCFNLPGFWYTGPWHVQQTELKKYVNEEYAEILRNHGAKLKLWEAELEIQIEDFITSFRRKIMRVQSTALEEMEVQSKRKEMVKGAIQNFRKLYPGVGPARVQTLTMRLENCFDTFSTQGSSLVSFVQHTRPDEALTKVDPDVLVKPEDPLDVLQKVETPLDVAVKPEAPLDVAVKPEVLLDAIVKPEVPLDVPVKPEAPLTNLTNLEVPLDPCPKPKDPPLEPLPAMATLEKAISTVSLEESPLNPLLSDQSTKPTPTPENPPNKTCPTKRPLSPPSNAMIKPAQLTPAGGVGIFFASSQVKVSVKLQDTDATKTFAVPLNICLEQREEDESPVLVEEKNDHRKPGHHCINFYSMIMDPHSVHTPQRFAYNDIKEKLWAEEILAMFFKRLAKIIFQRFDADISSTVVAIGLPASTPGVCKQRIKTALQLAGLKSGGVFLQATTTMGLTYLPTTEPSQASPSSSTSEGHSLAFYARENSLDVALLELRNGKVSVVSLHPGLRIPGLFAPVEDCVSQKLAATLENMTRDSGVNVTAIKCCNCVVDITGFDPERQCNKVLKDNLEKQIYTAFTHHQNSIPSINITSVTDGILPGLTSASSSTMSRLPQRFQERFPFTIEVFGLAGNPAKKKLVLANEWVRECIIRIPVKDISVNKDQVTRVTSHRISSELSTTEMRFYAIHKDHSESSSWELQIRVSKEGVISFKSENIIKAEEGAGSSGNNNNPCTESSQLVKTLSNSMPREDYELTRKRLNRIWAASSNRILAPQAKKCKIDS